MSGFRLQVASFLLILYTTILIVITAGFLLDSDHLIQNSLGISIVGSALLFVGYLRADNVRFDSIIKSLLAATGILVVALFVSHLIYDISWDGQSYHSQEILLIADGWNPFKEKLAQSLPNSIFIQHYAKGYSYAASSIYMQTGLFEGAKALNILLMVSSYLMVAELLDLYAPKISAVNRQIIAILLACNPITIFELFTFYVDGQLSSACLILFSSIFLYKKDWKTASIVAACVIVILINLKFTSLVYAAVICAYGLSFLWFHNRKSLIRYSTVVAFSFIIGIFWVGYNPYIRNATETSHPFYPLMGSGAINIMEGTNAPPSFSEKNRFQKVLEANFSRSENIHNATVAPEPDIKIPFTFRMKEWIVFKSHSVIMGGFGPLWSGILILTFAFVLIAMVKYNRESSINRDFFFLISALLALMFINPEGWHSRYVPFIWFVPVAAVLFLAFNNLRLAKVLAGVMVVNLVGTSMVSLASDLLITTEIKSELAWLKKHNSVLVDFNSFDANKSRMADNDIQFVEGRPNAQERSNFDSLQIQNSQTIAYFKASPAQYVPGSLFNMLTGYAKKNIHGK